MTLYFSFCFTLQESTHVHIYIKPHLSVLKRKHSMHQCNPDSTETPPPKTISYMSDAAGLPGYSGEANLLDFISAIKPSIM